jgi:hypothetical protein
MLQLEAVSIHVKFPPNTEKNAPNIDRNHDDTSQNPQPEEQCPAQSHKSTTSEFGRNTRQARGANRKNIVASIPILSTKSFSWHFIRGAIHEKYPFPIGGRVRFSSAWRSFGAYTTEWYGRRRHHAASTNADIPMDDPKDAKKASVVNACLNGDCTKSKNLSSASSPLVSRRISDQPLVIWHESSPIPQPEAAKLHNNCLAAARPSVYASRFLCRCGDLAIWGELSTASGMSGVECLSSAVENTHLELISCQNSDVRVMRERE